MFIIRFVLERSTVAYVPQQIRLWSRRRSSLEGATAPSAGRFLDLSRSPGLVEPRLQRAIEAKNNKPAFAGDGLHPVIFKASRSLGTEIDINGTIRVDLQIQL
jgi:hypothetical protein